MWPRRFGSAMLAAKVLKDATDMDSHVFQSFAYEISVLASTKCVAAHGHSTK
jgi:hypothetical protein